MPNRYLDWVKQADADLAHSEHARDAGHYEWACFSAQQAAEKAVKSVFLKHGRDAWGANRFLHDGRSGYGGRLCTEHH